MNYERLLLSKMPGDTPKQQHDNYEALMKLLTQICYPRRGTEETDWDQYKIAELLTPHAPKEFSEDN